MILEKINYSNNNGMKPDKLVQSKQKQNQQSLYLCGIIAEIVIKDSLKNN